MYSPPLGRFLSRDPFPQAGEPDLLFDNNWFGHQLTRMRTVFGSLAGSQILYSRADGLITDVYQVTALAGNAYLYADANPLSRIDPTGMQSVDCGCLALKEEKYCVYEFVSRTGVAKDCLGFDINDVICCACPTGLFARCEKEKKITVEINHKVTCEIKFKATDRKCTECPNPAKACDDTGNPFRPKQG
jgi:hypothetical protein